ncbi:MAG: MoxR family ATPase [Caldilineales bacterium]|nr:MoxR family ATPase [Caldilineales bacterium]
MTAPAAAANPHAEVLRRALDEIGRRIVGQRQMVERLAVGLLTGGHVLLEGVPGLAKTLAVKTLAETFRATFSRIQFTPDLLPADIVGTMIFDPKTQEFRPKQGPLFANLVLADEINRAPAKVQSALLEAMQEHQVSIGGQTYLLPEPFLVLATQNPIEYEGTFPLPEAQVDRFIMRIHLGYPDRKHEVAILDSQVDHHPIEDIAQVVSAEELTAAQDAVKTIYVDEQLKNYIISLTTATREHPDVYLGASPRGSLALFKTARAFAAAQSRDYVIPDDVKALAVATLAHRLIISPSARIKNVNPETIVQETLNTIAIPGARSQPKA